MEDLKYFFSYARKDSEFVLRVAKDLRAVGASLWLDQLDIVAGQRWDRAVEEALKICQGLIVVLSPESLASDNVMDEVSYALEEEKMVLPIVVRPCDIPFRLRRVQHIEFTANYETGFSQLLRAMRLEQPLQPIQPTAPEAPVVHDDTAPSEEKSMESPGMSRPPRFRISLIAAGLIIMAGLLVIFVGGQTLYRSLSARKSEQTRKALEEATHRVADKKQTIGLGPSATVPVANCCGAVLIKTEPPGAIVTLGDESKKSPATFNRIKVGSWVVRAEFDGYEPAEQQVAVEENQISDPGVIKLIRSTGTARVSTSPEGTDFDLVDADGQHHTAKTPAQLRDLPVGYGNIIFNREGMASHSQGIKVERNQVASIIWNAPVGSVSLATPQPSAAASPATSVADRSFTNSLGCTMVWIPSLRIWVTESEVTQREFSSLMDHNPSDHVGADLPVDSVTEPEAMEFCDRLSKKDTAAGVLPSGYAYTLPTDEQWTVFCGDASLGDAVTSQDKPRNGPKPVKNLGPNQYGLYDTRGNVWEWTRTKYAPSLNSLEIRAEFPFGVVQSGPRKGEKKGIDPEGLVLRGGSWRSKGDLLKTTTRGSNSPTTRDNTNGFRIVLAPRE
jgi:formylglycine-generating enzyme required for sulfatase activity